MIKRHTIPSYHLEGICKKTAATESGLTGTEIGKILVDCGITTIKPRQKLSNIAKALA